MTDMPLEATGIIAAVAGSGRHRVRGVAVPAGSGVVVTLAGGERPHVGAVGVGIPRPGPGDPGCISATSSVFSVTGHRDDELAKPLAEHLAAQLGQVAVVVVGVHVDGATAEDIALLSTNVREAAAGLLEQLSARRRRNASGSEGA